MTTATDWPTLYIAARSALQDGTGRPFHNKAVDLPMLTAFAGPPVRHALRRGYQVEPRFNRRVSPRPVRPNSVKRVECPVEPIPARDATALKIMFNVAFPPAVPTWHGSSRVHTIPDSFT